MNTRAFFKYSKAVYKSLRQSFVTNQYHGLIMLALFVIVCLAAAAHGKQQSIFRIRT